MCVKEKEECAAFPLNKVEIQETKYWEDPSFLLFHVDEVEVIKYMVMTVTMDMESSPSSAIRGSERTSASIP